MTVEKEQEEVKEPVIGQFKTRRKFLSFVSSIKGAKVRLLRETAFIKGEKLSGVLEGIKFKLTICDEGTINFEEVDEDAEKGVRVRVPCDRAQLKRLIEEIESREVIGYAQKFVFNLQFEDVDGNSCYLEVENQKPIDKLASIFDKPEKNLSDKGFSILDALFSSETDEELTREFEGESDEEILSEKDAKILLEAIENPAEPNEKLKNAAESYMEEQFRKMNEEKIKELNERIKETKIEIVSLRSSIRQGENGLEQKSKELKILEARLESLEPITEPNGWVFNVSEEIKNEAGLKEEDKTIVDKISELMNLKKDALYKILTEGYYRIRISEKGNYQSEVKVDSEILEKMKFDPMGKIKMSEEGVFEYRGELNWHQLVNKMIRSGFEQDPEFDKVCKSNSYESHEQEVEEQEVQDIQDVVEVKEEGKKPGFFNRIFNFK